MATIILVSNSHAAVRYVNASNPNPAPPYTTWETAASQIQDAIDRAAGGDEILVTNGIYRTGGRTALGSSVTNRVVVNKPVYIHSVNGPEVTAIEGYQVPGTTNGNSAVRCVYLDIYGSLAGFTVTNGATKSSGNLNQDQSGGGIWSTQTGGVVSNCVLAGNSAAGNGGGAYYGTLLNCVLMGNSASNGAGAFSATLLNCSVSNNQASYQGGGVNSGTLSGCTLAGNRAGFSGGGSFHANLTNSMFGANSAPYGGGADGGTLTRCTLTNNSAFAVGIDGGGGANFATLFNCALAGNSAFGYGGGAAYGTLNNCVLNDNVSRSSGGGAYSATLNNCNLTGNSAPSAGGALACTLRNCILYFNKADFAVTFNYSGGTLNYCCTTPLASGGVGNIDADPQLASASHLNIRSPCRGAGSAAYAKATDIDGETWASPPSIGCDELYAGAATGVLTASFRMPYTTVAVGYPVEMVEAITGPATASRWDFGDGTAVSNCPSVSHAWKAPGDYTISLSAYNDGASTGVSSTAQMHVVPQPIYYAAAESPTPVAPYTNWATAATNIQDAVDAAALPGALVMVSDGIYETGGRAVIGAYTNRVAATVPVTIQSLNGPRVTQIRGSQVAQTVNGDGAIRCVYLANGATLAGFTLTNGATAATTDMSGGGVWCESPLATVSNCVIMGNSAFRYGGGAFSGTLYNCLLASNSAYSAGGAYRAALYNCTVAGNSALQSGGGTAGGTVNNSIIYYNSSPSGSNYSNGILNYCCAAPLPAQADNFSYEPLFIDSSSGDFHLLPDSPCINAGRNGYVSSVTDLDGNTRIARGTVDVGAFEYQDPSSSISYAWLQQYGLPVDGSVDLADPDNDAMNNWTEWLAGTDPTNSLSTLRMWVIRDADGSAAVAWTSVTNRLYALERAVDLRALPAFSILRGDIPGSNAVTSVSLTNAANVPDSFYRVRVEQ